MNPDNYFFYSTSGCNFSLIPHKPKIPVLTVRKEMYPFRFNENSSSFQGNFPNGLKQSEKFSFEVEIQFVRESDKSTINTIRKHILIDNRLTLADLPTQLLIEIGCIIDPTFSQVEVFGLRLLNWSCLLPLDVVSEDLNLSTVGEKLSVFLNYLLFFYRVSIKACHEVTSLEVWSIIRDLVKRYTAEGAYHRLKQMNCPLIKTNSTIFYDFLFQSSSNNLDNLDQIYQLSFLDIFSFDNWYRSFPINQFLNGIKALQTNSLSHHSLDSMTFEKLTNSLSEALKQKGTGNTDISRSTIDQSCDTIIQETLLKMKPDSNHINSSEKTISAETPRTCVMEEHLGEQKTSSESSSSFFQIQFKTVKSEELQLNDNRKPEKKKVRNRVTFVVEDLKQLEEWFKENPRPSREKFQEYAIKLNQRHQGNHNKAKRTLHSRNIIYWFKNARAAYKRLTITSSCDIGERKSSRMHQTKPSNDKLVDDIEQFQDHQLSFKQENVDHPDDESGYTPAKSVDSEASTENVFLQQETGSIIGMKESTSLSSDFEKQQFSNGRTDSETPDFNISKTAKSSPMSYLKNTSTNETPDIGYSNKDVKICKSASIFRGGKRRARIFLDPASEVNRLEQWFQAEKYPDIIQIENYTNILNLNQYRQSHFRKLVPENVTLWFKNRRARLKRCGSCKSADVS